MESKKYQLNKEDMIKVGKGFLIAIAGVAVTYGTQIVTEIDFGDYSAVVVAISGVVINLIRKFISQNE